MYADRPVIVTSAHDCCTSVPTIRQLIRRSCLPAQNTCMPTAVCDLMGCLARLALPVQSTLVVTVTQRGLVAPSEAVCAAIDVQ
jgi:hypothetical protein